MTTMTKKSSIALLALIVSVVVTSNASAVVIRNTTTSTILFSDDFQGTAPVTVGFADDPGTDRDSTATTGSWAITESDNTQIQVTNFTGTSSAPLAYPGSSPRQGGNYMWLNRTGGFNSAVATPTSLQTTGGESIQIEWQMYIRDFPNGAGPGVFSLYNTLGTAGLVTALVVDGNNSISGGGSLTYLDDTWQTWTVDYVVGAGTFDLTIGGVTETGISVTGGAAGSVGAVRFGSSTAVEYFIDGGSPVPEPSALMLLSLGLIGLVGGTRRRKKSC